MFWVHSVEQKSISLKFSKSRTPIIRRITLESINKIVLLHFTLFHEEDARSNNPQVSQFIYSCKTLYMFQAVFSSIIRSS